MNRFIGIALLALVAAGCGDNPTPRSGKPKVVCTIGMIGDLARRVAGDHADVHTMMGPGVDPHLYHAGENDIRLLSEADLILYNGLHLEGKMGDILDKLGRTREVTRVTRTVPEASLRQPPEFEGQHDPHVWFDVRLWAHTIDAIVAALSKIDPPHAPDFRINGDALRKELLELDGWVEKRIQSIPKNQRVLITAHDAFGYFGARYGIEVRGLQGISTATQAGTRDVNNLVDLIVRRKIRAVFVESSVPKRTIEAVQAACRSRGHDVAIGGELFSDAMGAADTPEGTYLGMVRHNVETIVAALAGDS